MRRPAVVLVLAAVSGLACGHPPVASPVSSSAVHEPPPASLLPPAATLPSSPPGPTRQEALHRGILARLAAPVAQPCTEQDLPRALHHKKPPPGDDLGIDNLGRGLAFGVPHGTVTAGRAAGSEVAVYLSYAFDPSSELGDGGYRVALRDLATGKKRDAALGFAMMRPYIVFHDAKLPLVDGDTLQVAADVREIDDASITLPPVALRAKREAPNKLLRCSLAALFADADGDGATDIEEARLATDPAERDTDGDGLADAVDPAPLGSDPPRTPEEELWVRVVKEVVAQKVGAEMVIVVTEGPRLAVTDTPLRVLELTKDELDAYQKRFGQRMVAGVEVKMVDESTAKVSVSLGWTGGWFDAHKDGTGIWTIGVRSWWVT
jgi:hypothetical protein